MEKSFKELLKESFKSNDTEEWLDIYFTRPIGLAFALMWKKLGVTPNYVTILSMFLGLGAGWMFHYTDLWSNLCGVILLMFANFCDSTDGQLARLTNHRTLVGRMLDGFASDVWFAAVYLGIVARLWHQNIPFTDTEWSFWILLLCAYAGLRSHSLQCSLADYYRQIHLYFIKGEAGSELDSYASQQAIYDNLPREGAFWDHAFYYFYKGYCKKQERQTPEFQKFFKKIKSLYPTSADIPQHLREDFRSKSLPLMKYTNILTHNTRAIVLFISALLDIPYVYPLFEIVVLTTLYYYMRAKHENICRNYNASL